MNENRLGLVPSSPFGKVRMNHKLHIKPLLVVAASSALTCSPVWGQTYSIKATAPGFETTSVNSSGDVSGRKDDFAAIWLSGMEVGLVPNAGTGSMAYAINDKQEAAVTAKVGGYTQAARYNAKSGMLVKFGKPSNWYWSNAYAINNNSSVCGKATTTDPKDVAVLFDVSGTIFPLDPGRYGASAVFGMNDNGLYAGYSRYYRDQATVFYSKYSRLELPDFGGGASCARAVSNANRVVGEGRTLAGTVHPFYYDVGGSGVMIDLMPGDAGNGYALAVNLKGTICGYVNRGGEDRAVVWKDGSAIDLTSSLDSTGTGIVVNRATGINADGTVCANGHDSSGNPIGLILVPTPSLTLALSQASVVGGSTAKLTGTVTLATPAPADGLTVRLASTLAEAQVPASIFIRSQATKGTFVVTASRVPSAVSGKISASGLDANPSASLTVKPFAATSVKATPSKLLGGSAFEGKVSLSAVAKSPVTVSLSSADTDVARVPATVTVPANASSASFAGETFSVAGSRTVLISASVDGSRVERSIAVLPGISSVKFDSGTWYGHAPTGVTVKIPFAAPAGGRRIDLSGSGLEGLPDSIIVPEGATSMRFLVVGQDVAASTTATIVASVGNASITATKSVAPNTIKEFSVSPATFVGGSTTAVKGRLVLRATVAADTTIFLASSSNAAAPPTTIIVPAGANSVEFDITHTEVQATAYAKVDASRLGFTRSVTLKILAP